MIKGLVSLFFCLRHNVSAKIRERFTAALKWKASRSLQRINMGKSRHDWYILVDGLWVEIHIQNDVQKWNRKVKFLRFSEASWCTKLFQMSELKCYQGDSFHSVNLLYNVPLSICLFTDLSSALRSTLYKVKSPDDAGTRLCFPCSFT